MEDELEQCKSAIRGVLTSSVKPLTVIELIRDYKSIAGDNIPFRNFGYRSLYEFLLSIPDTVRLQKPEYSNSVVLPIQTQDTAHVKKLVQEQKRNSKPRRSGSHRGNRASFRRNKITYDFRKAVYKFISTFPKNSVDIKVLEKEVKTLQYVHNLSDYSFHEILDNIRDFVDVNYNLVSLKHPRVIKNFKFADAKSSFEVPSQVTILADEESDLSADEMEQFCIDSETSENYKSKTSDILSQRCASRASNLDEDALSFTEEFDIDNPIVSKHLIGNLVALFDDKENANGIWMTDLTTKYSLKYGYALQPDHHGFHDVMDLVVNLPNIFVTKQYRAEGDWLLLDARKHRKEENVELQGEITKTLLSELKRLLRKTKQLSADELATEYKLLPKKFRKKKDKEDMRAYQKTLRPEDYGFKTMDVFLKALNESSHEIIFRSVRGRTLISLNISSSDELPLGKEQNDDLASYNFNPFPEEVCGPTFVLERDHSIDNLVPGETFKVVMGEIYTPGKFFIHLKQNEPILRMMMEDLHEFYTVNEKEYEILSSSLIIRGLLCACPYSGDSRWHRVEVMYSRTTKAKVLFIDYGTVEEVDIAKLRYLHKDFAKHPPLCLKAKLGGIEPKRVSDTGAPLLTYGKVVADRFYALTLNVDLEAELIKNHVELRCLEIFLYRIIEDEERIPIHKKLIEFHLVNEKKIVPDPSPIPNSVRIKMNPQQMSTTKTKNEAYVSSALQTRPNEICTTSSPTSTAPGFEMAVKMPLINDTEVHHVAVNTNGTTERLKIGSVVKPPPGIGPPPGFHLGSAILQQTPPSYLTPLTIGRDYYNQPLNSSLILSNTTLPSMSYYNVPLSSRIQSPLMQTPSMLNYPYVHQNLACAPSYVLSQPMTPRPPPGFNHMNFIPPNLNLNNPYSFIPQASTVHSVSQPNSNVVFQKASSNPLCEKTLLHSNDNCICNICPEDTSPIAYRKDEVKSVAENDNIALNLLYQRVEKVNDEQSNAEKKGSDSNVQEIIRETASNSKNLNNEERYNEQSLRERLAVENTLNKYLNRNNTEEKTVCENLNSPFPDLLETSTRLIDMADTDKKSESLASKSINSSLLESSVNECEFSPKESKQEKTLNVSQILQNTSNSKGVDSSIKTNKLNPIKEFVKRHSKGVPKENSYV